MKFVFAILTALAFSSTALAVTDEEEARYVKSFSGDQCLHSDAADTFAWMGISDTRVCDIVEKRLLEDHQVARNDRHEKNRVARYIRVLAFCGQPKYVPTLNNFVTDCIYDALCQSRVGRPTAISKMKSDHRQSRNIQPHAQRRCESGHEYVAG